MYGISSVNEGKYKVFSGSMTQAFGKQAGTGDAGGGGGLSDNLPIATAKFSSNWALSSARASSVVCLFIEQGLAAERLKASGHADNDPVASNDSNEGWARNRRVTVSVLATPPEAAISSGES